MPAGVGYSTCDNITETNDTIPCYNETKRHGILNDDNVANETLTALIYFFHFNFPEWRRLNMYIAGESYAGIYIPYIMDKIDWYNQVTPGVENDINLKGGIIGNGCTNWR
jgi:carboxypeptidase C (cathepsin A)